MYHQNPAIRWVLLFLDCFADGSGNWLWKCQAANGTDPSFVSTCACHGGSKTLTLAPSLRAFSKTLHSTLRRWTYDFFMPPSIVVAPVDIESTKSRVQSCIGIRHGALACKLCFHRHKVDTRSCGERSKIPCTIRQLSHSARFVLITRVLYGCNN